MKWFSSILSFILGGGVCLAAGFLTTEREVTEQTEVVEQTIEIEDQEPVVPSLTVSPEIPSQITFCGETVDLTRYNMYEGIDRELSSFTYFHSTTMLLFKRANRYFPVIEPILKANNIPDDFKYLAVIESHLDPSAKSPARAIGMWQFMESTAKEKGLTVTTTVDERYHVRKSTEAACRYLKEAYAKYGDWVSVASSYNAGMGRISSEFSKQQVPSSLDLWLVEETMRYAYRMFAIKLIFENPYKYGFALHAKNLYKPIVCDEITVSNDISDLVAFAKSHDITYADLKRFNPWLRDTKLLTNGKQYIILIPRKKDMYYQTPNRTVHDPRWIAR